MSDIGFGPDASVNVEVTADASKAAAELEDAFREAVQKALSSEGGRAAIQGFLKSFSVGFAKIGKQQEQTWKQATQQGVRAAQTIGKAFEQVAKSSQKAFSANQARGSSHELQALNALVAGLAGNFDRLATDIRTTNTVLKEMGSGARAQLAAIERERRSGVLAQTTANAAANTASQLRAAQIRKEGVEAAAAARVQSAIIRTSSAERVAQIRRFTQIATTSIRSLTQVFRTTFNAASNIVRGFVRGAESLLSGIGRGVGKGLSAAFRGLAATARAAVAGLSRVFSSGNSKDENAWKTSLSRREKALQSSLNNQSRAIQSFQTRTSRGLAGAITGRGALGIGAGLAGGAGIGALLTSGFQRAGDVEQLQLTFKALLGSAPQADAVLGRLSDFARTTSFDFVEVAQSVAQLTAALGDVDKAEQLTKFLSDVVALTGGTTEALGRVRLAMSQIAGAGRLDSANLRQITESLPGVPIAQILADKFFGGDVAAYSAARDAGELGGKISAEAFFTAFQEGTKERFPEVEGFAQVAAGTLTGLTQNLKENFAIFGATIISLAQGPIKASIGFLNNFLGLAGSFVSGEMFSTTGATTPWGSQLVVGLSDTMKKLEVFREILGHVLIALGGLLALKGVYEVFGLLGTAIRLALTPMGLLVVAVSGVVAAWTIFMHVSQRFATTWKVVTNQFKPAIDAIVRLGRAFRGAFSSGGGGDGKPSLLTRIGDAMRYVNVALARLVAGVRDFANVLSEGLELNGFKDFLGSLDSAAAAGLAILFHGTESKAALDKARSEGGSVVLNLLEDTFLGPIIRFFRGPFLNVAKSIIGFISNIVGQIASAVGDIWGTIFHGRSGSDNIQNVILGEQDDRTTGTKILDRLEQTFLRPVVEFFRGPFADVIESIGNFIGGLFEDFIIPGFKGVFNFFAHDFIPGVISVGKAIGSFLAPAVQTIGNLLGQVGTLLAPIGGAVQGFVDTWKTEGVAKAFSSLWDGVVDAAGNIWEGEDGSGGIKAGLESALDSISNWFSTTFTGKNATGWALSALEGLRIVGEKVGRFLSSPEFLGTVIIATTAVAGAIAAIIGAFTVGFAQGVLAEIPRWAGIISKGLSAAWDALSGGALKFLPDPVINAINAVLGSPLLASGIAVGTVALGGVILSKLIGGIATGMTRGEGAAKTTSFANLGLNIASGLFNSVISGFKGVGKGALSLAQMILPKFPTGTGGTERTIGSGIGSRIIGGMNSLFRTVANPLGALATGLRNAKANAVANFGSVGTAIGSAIVGGIAAFEFGNYAGKTGSGGKMILALLGGGATGAAIGTAILPGVGTAIGAVLGTAIAGIGVAFGQAAKKAQDLRDNINEIRDALKGLSGEDVNAALFDTLTDRLLTDPAAFDAWGQSLVDSGFDFRNFTDQIVDGTAEADSAFTDYLGRLGTQLEGSGADVDKFNERMRKIAATASSGTFTNLNDLLYAALGTNNEVTAFNQSLEDLGVTGDDLNSVFKYLQGGIEGGTSAFKLLNTETAITANILDTVDEAVSAIQDGLAQGNTAQQLADILSNDDLSSANALQALRDAAGEVADRLDKAKEAFLEALDAIEAPGTVQKGTFAGITDDIIAGLPDVASEFQRIMEDTEITPNVRTAKLNLATSDFTDEIAGAVSDAVDAGLITDDASMDTFLTNLKTQINSAGLDEDTANMLNGVVDAFIAGDYDNLLDPITRAMTDQATLAETGRIMAERLTSAFRTTLGAAQALGGPAALGTLVGTGAAPSNIAIPQLDLSGVINPADTAAVGQAGGSQVADAFGPGFTGGRSKIISHIKTDIDAVGTSVAPVATKAGYQAGLTFSSGYAGGIKGGTGAAVGSAGSMGRAAAFAAAISSLQMFTIGANAGQAFARGMLAQVSAAARAAQAIAQAATNAAKSALKIKSPSQVFVDIGKQIGAGFVEGIKVAETSMTEALEKALTNAVKNATEKAAVEVNRANVAGTLFDLLQPSTLPGGTKTTAVTNAGTDLTKQIAGFLPDLRSNLSDALSDAGSTGLADAKAAINGIALDLASSFSDLRGQLADATKAKTDIAAYDKALAALRTQLNNGTLANAAASRERSEAYKALISDQQAMNDKIARLRVQLNNGRISATTFNEKVKDLKDSFAATSVEQYQTELDRINRAFKAGTLGAEEYKTRLQDLGSRPSPLSFDQKNLLASGISTLNVGTIAGRANRETLSDALGKIREFGQAALEAGTPLATVITQMNLYTAKVVAQARAMGLATVDVNALVSAFGLTTVQLNALKAGVVSLNINTVQGAQNVAAINEQLGNIRGYASTLLEAGDSASTVVTKIKALRDSLVAQAKAFGFNATSIDSLVNAAGLSNSALAEFIKQLNDFTKAANGAAAATPGAPSTAETSVVRPIGEMHLHLPYGDPESVALAVTNAIAYGGPTSW